MNVKALVRLLIAIPFFIIYCCSVDNLFNESKETGSVNINISNSRSIMGDLYNSVTTFSLEVTGDGMSTIDETFSIGDTIIIELPVGKDRVFILKAFNGTGLEMFRSSLTVDIEPGSITLEMILTKLNGLVSFDANGGTVTGMPPMVIEDAYTVGFPIFSEPTRTNYLFDGWWNDRSDGLGNFSVQFDTELYNMEFDIDGDKIADEYIHLDSAGVADPGTFYRLSSVWPISDIILYAMWEDNLYTITYDNNEASYGTITGTVPAPQDVEGGSSVTVAGNPGGLTVITGAPFTYWTTTPQDTPPTYNNSTLIMPYSDITLYAQYGGV